MLMLWLMMILNFMAMTIWIMIKIIRRRFFLSSFEKIGRIDHRRFVTNVIYNAGIFSRFAAFSHAVAVAEGTGSFNAITGIVLGRNHLVVFRLININV